MTAMSRNPIMAMFAADQIMLVAADQRDLFLACLNGLSANKHLDEMLAEATTTTADNFWPEPDSWRAQYRPYVVKDAILHIPVRGMLLHGFPWADGNWATGYEYIQRAFERGCADFKAGNIKGIAFISHSGGGQVAGCWDTVDKMEAMKAESGVPVRAFAHEAAYSAAYGTISIADHIAVSRSGGVGSIGTVRTHIDWSKWNEKAGLAYTFIEAGKFKTDGHPDKPLSASAIARWEEQVTELNEIFVAAVARNRNLDPQTIRDFEAATFSASQALSNGLADSIGALDDALAAFAADLTPHEEEDQMSTPDNNPQAVDPAALESMLAQARTEGAVAERGRVNAILAADSAKDRPKAALSAALKTDMTVEQASAFLADLPAEAAAVVTPTAPVEATAPAGVSGQIFDAAMDNTGNPNVGAPAASNLAPEDDAIEQSFAGRSRKKAA